LLPVCQRTLSIWKFENSIIWKWSSSSNIQINLFPN